MGLITLGVDIGQRVDPTAIAVVDAELREVGGKWEEFHTVRFMTTLTLGTPYPDVARAIKALVADLAPRAPLGMRLYADATGVGKPVVDMLRDAGITVYDCYFNYGQKRTVHDDGAVIIGKAWLVSRLQSLMQTQRIRVPRTPEASALVDELLNYEIRVDPDGDAKFGAFKVGKHDDLVTALGLGVQDTPPQPFQTAVIRGNAAVEQYQQLLPRGLGFQ